MATHVCARLCVMNTNFSLDLVIARAKNGDNKLVSRESMLVPVLSWPALLSPRCPPLVPTP